MRIPPGLNTVTPYFFVDDAACFIDFLVRGLGGVESADAAMARAIAAGATKVMDIAVMPYNDRQGGVKDTSGNLWWISQRLVEEPYQP